MHSPQIIMEMIHPSSADEQKSSVQHSPQQSQEWALRGFRHYSMPVVGGGATRGQMGPLAIFSAMFWGLNNEARTFSAVPLSDALSLALFPSRPSWTNNSKRFTSSSSTSCSPCKLAAMLARALITAREQCLIWTETKYEIRRKHTNQKFHSTKYDFFFK